MANKIAVYEKRLLFVDQYTQNKARKSIPGLIFLYKGKV